MLLFKLVEVGPGVSQIRVDFNGSLKPLSSLTDLPLSPKQPVAERERERERGGGYDDGSRGSEDKDTVMQKKHEAEQSASFITRRCELYNTVQ